MQNSTQKMRYSVSGRVQGVWFRAHTSDKARKAGVTGWVRNAPDGRVEGEAYGSSEALDEFTAWLQVGSPASEVEQVTVEREEPGSGEIPKSFEVRR